MEDYNKLITKNEDQKQFVTNCLRLPPSFSRFNKENIITIVHT